MVQRHAQAGTAFIDYNTIDCDADWREALLTAGRDCQGTVRDQRHHAGFEADFSFNSVQDAVARHSRDSLKEGILNSLMEMYVLHLEATSIHYENDIPMPDNLDHWRPMVRHFAQHCNRFRADCWPRDAAALAMFQPYVETQSPPGASPVVVVGRLAPDLLEMILSDPFDADGAVKWFTLLLAIDDTIVMSSAHNGAEIFCGEVSDEELAWIQSILPQHVRLSTWSKEEMAQLPGDQPATDQRLDAACVSSEKLEAVGAAFIEALVEILSPAGEAAPAD